MRDETAELAVILALSAKPHAKTLHKGTNIVRNALEDAKKLNRAALALQRAAEAQSNGIERWDAKAGQRIASWTEEDDKRNETIIAKARARIRDIVHDYETEARLSDGEGKLCRVYFQRDPRGAAVRVAFTGGTWAS